MLFSLFLVLTFLLSAATGQILWLTATTSNWNNVANWAGGTIPLLGNLATEIIVAGTYTVNVDVNVALTGTGSLTIGSDLTANVNPTLSVNSGIKAFFATLNVQNGASIVLNNGAELWVTNLQFTAANASAVVSGNGKLYVNGTLTYVANNGNLVLPVQVNTSGVTVGNGATVQLTSSGGCWGNGGGAGSINLGSGGGGNVLVTSNFDLGNCQLSGSGNLTLNSANTQAYVLAQGSHTAGYIKAQGSAQLSLAAGGATTITATAVWIGGSGRLLVQQSTASTTTTVNGDVQIVAQGTYSVGVNSNLVVSGKLWVGSDTTSGVVATVTVANGVWVNTGSLNLATGGNVALGANGGLLATSVTATGSNTAALTISGNGWFNVTSVFQAQTSGATVQVNSPFALSGDLTLSNNHTLIVNSNSGWSSGSINLGASGQGGTLVIQGSWTHTTAPTGAGGTIVFNPSASTTYALVAGVYGVAWVKVQNQARLWVGAATATSISGGLWIQNNARVTVNQTLNVGQAILVAGNGVFEVAQADVVAANATFQSSSQYIIWAATSTPPKLTVTGQATFSGTIHIVSQILVDGTANVTVVAYGSRTGAFASVSASATGTLGMGALPVYSTSRRLLASSAYNVNYGSSSAEAYRFDGSGAASLSPSTLFLGLIVSLLGFLLH